MSSPALKAPEQHDEDPRAQLVSELGLAFKRVFRVLSRIRGRDTHLAAGELSHAQFQLLVELANHEAMSAGELASAADLSAGTVTQMLEALADSGHVERLRSRADRRVVVSQLTPLGHERVQAKRAAWREQWEAALADVSDEELRAAERVLDALAAMFERSGGESPCRAGQEAAGEARAEGRKPV